MTKQPQQNYTTDYSRFRFHTQNRIVVSDDGKPVPRKDLIDSMKKHGFLKEHAIKVYEDPDKKFTILDGHNRFVSAMSLSLPVEYIAYQRNGTVLTPVDYSRSQKGWSLDQFIHAHAAAGNEAFIELVEFSTKTGIGLGSSGSLLSGHSAGSGNVHQQLKDGAWKIKDRVYAELVASVISLMSQFKPFTTSK